MTDRRWSNARHSGPPFTGVSRSCSVCFFEKETSPTQPRSFTPIAGSLCHPPPLTVAAQVCDVCLSEISFSWSGDLISENNGLPVVLLLRPHLAITKATNCCYRPHTPFLICMCVPQSYTKHKQYVELTDKSYT